MQGGPFLAHLSARSEPSEAQAKGGPKGPDERADAVFGAWAPNRRSCAERRARNGSTVKRNKATPEQARPDQQQTESPEQANRSSGTRISAGPAKSAQR